MIKYSERIKLDLSKADNNLLSFAKCSTFEETIREAINIGVNYGSFIRTRDIVKNMITNNISIEDIVKISELDEKQVLEICDMLEEI